MNFDWKEYLNLARFLQNCCDSDFSQEASSRSSVSRAYFAAFCCARNYARDKLNFTSEKTPDVHEDVRTMLEDNGMSNEAEILDQLRKWRNECDYEDTIHTQRLSRILTDSLKRAESLINSL